MSFVQSVANQIIGALLQLLMMIVSRDRRSVILERRAKVLALAKDLKAAGMSATDLRKLERSLTREDT